MLSKRLNNHWRVKTINLANKKQKVRINKFITAPTVRLTDDQDRSIEKELDQRGIRNVKLGVMSRDDALRLARQLELDLVEISPNAEPPVVRILDYGKFLFDEKKKKKEQKAPKLKEIKFRPVTGEGDYQVKLRNLKNFLENGDKVKVSLRFRGREITHQELGSDLMQRICKDVEGVGLVDQLPKLEGRQMVMIINPKRKSSKSNEKNAE